jgi:hypothetical protein
MSIRTPREASEAFLASHRRMLSCVTTSVLIEGLSPPRTPFDYLGGDRPVPLRGPLDLSLQVLIGFVVVDATNSNGPSQVQVTDYAYAVHRTDGREVLAYHWHPFGLSPMTEPHVHLSGVLSGVELTK